MILSHSKKFICLNPPKTGSGFREMNFKIFTDYGIITHQDQKCRHWNINKSLHFLNENHINPDDYFWFTFIRNPWDRMVSWYNMAVNFKVRDKGEDINIYLKPERFSIFCKHRSHDARDLNLHEFWLSDKIELDFVGKLENMERDMNYVCKKIGIDIEIEKQEQLLIKYHDKINELWTQESIDYIAEREKLTIEKFNYDYKQS